MAADRKQTTTHDTGHSSSAAAAGEPVTILYDNNKIENDDVDFEHTVQHHILRTTATIPRSASSTIADATPSPSNSSASPRQPELPGFIGSSSSNVAAALIGGGAGGLPGGNESGTFDSHIQAHVAAVTRGAEYRRRRRSVSGSSRDRSSGNTNDKAINNVQITTVTKVKTHNLKQKSVATDTLSLPTSRMLLSSSSSRSPSPSASGRVAPPLFLSSSSTEQQQPQRLAPLATVEHDEDELLTVSQQQQQLLRPSPVISTAYRRTQSSSSSSAASSALHTRTTPNNQPPLAQHHHQQQQQQQQQARHLRQHMMAMAAKQQNRLDVSPISVTGAGSPAFLDTVRSPAIKSTGNSPHNLSPSRYLLNALAHHDSTDSNVAQKALERLAERQLIIINDVNDHDENNNNDDDDDSASITAPPSGQNAHISTNEHNSTSSPSNSRTATQQKSVGITVTKTVAVSGGPNVADSVLKRLLDRTPRNSISMGSASENSTATLGSNNNKQLNVAPHDNVLRHRAHSGDETQADKNKHHHDQAASQHQHHQPMMNERRPSRLSRAWERISHSARTSPKRQQNHLQQQAEKNSSPSPSIAEATLGRLLMRTPRQSVSGRGRGSSGGSLAATADTTTIATASSSSSSSRRHRLEPMTNDVIDAPAPESAEPPLLHQQIMTALRHVAEEQQQQQRLAATTPSVHTTPKQQLRSPHKQTGVAQAKLHALLHHTPRHSFSEPASGMISLSPAATRSVTHSRPRAHLADSTTITTTAVVNSVPSRHNVGAPSAADDDATSMHPNALSSTSSAVAHDSSTKPAELSLPGTVGDNSRSNSSHNEHSPQHKISTDSSGSRSSVPAVPATAKHLRHIDSEDVATIRSSSDSESNAFLTSNDSPAPPPPDTPSNTRRPHLLDSEKSAWTNKNDVDVEESVHANSVGHYDDEPPPLETSFDELSAEPASTTTKNTSNTFTSIIPPLRSENQNINVQADHQQFRAAPQQRPSNIAPTSAVKLSVHRASLPTHSPYTPDHENDVDDEFDHAARPHRHRASVDTVKTYQHSITTTVHKIAVVVAEFPPLQEASTTTTSEKFLLTNGGGEVEDKKPKIISDSVQISTHTPTRQQPDTQQKTDSITKTSPQTPLYHDRSRQPSAISDISSLLSRRLPPILSPAKSSALVVQGSNISHPSSSAGSSAASAESHINPRGNAAAFLLPSLSSPSSSSSGHRPEPPSELIGKHAAEHTSGGNSTAASPTAARRPSLADDNDDDDDSCQQQQQQKASLTTTTTTGSTPNPSLSVDFFRRNNQKNDDDDMTSQQHKPNVMATGSVINSLTSALSNNKSTAVDKKVVNQHEQPPHDSRRRRPSSSSNAGDNNNNVVTTNDGDINGVTASLPTTTSSLNHQKATKTESLLSQTSSVDSKTASSSPSPSASSATTATTTPTKSDYGKNDDTADSTVNDVPPLLLHSQFAQHLFKPPPPIERIYSLGEIKRHSHDTLSMKAAIIAGLPSIETLEACDKAAERLKEVARLLTATAPATTNHKHQQDGTVNGDRAAEDHLQVNNESPTNAKTMQVQLPNGVVSLDYLHTSILYAAQVLEALYRNEARMRTMDEDEFTADEIAAMPGDVRTWLQATFTKHDEKMKKASAGKPRFKGVARAIKAGITVDRLMRSSIVNVGIAVPEQVLSSLKRVDNWEFDVFEFHELSGGHSLRFIASYIMSQYGILQKFRINPTTLENFLLAMEAGYSKNGNPYHNTTHAADVVQTMHYIITQANLNNWLTELELFATIISAIIHDYEHSGTTNSFHIMTDSDLALLYNDKTILESYHLSATFRLVREKPDCNVFSNMAKEDYRLMRALAIDMVLSTDMSLHAQKVKEAKTFIKQPEITDRSKVLGYVLHACDISHGAKPWLSHNKWSELIFAEYFAQGDRERELGIAISPLCDRSKILLPQSQIGYIDYVVEPTWVLCGDLVESVLARHYNEDANNGNNDHTALSANEQRKLLHQHHQQARIRKPWTKYIAENKQRWQERVASDIDKGAVSF